VDRSPQRATLDACIREMPHQRVAVRAEVVRVDQNGAEPPIRVGSRRCIHQGDSRYVFESACVPHPVLALGLHEPGQLFHLCGTDRGKHVGQAVVVAHGTMDVADWVVLRLGREVARALRQRRIVGEDDATPPVVAILLPLKERAPNVPMVPACRPA